MSVFRFPRTRFVGELTVVQQFKHVRSEVDEVWQELEPGYPDRFDGERVAEELIDLIHSAETMLRILEERHGVAVGRVSAGVRIKNYTRGYYDAAE